MKFIFPSLWILGFGLGTVAVWLQPMRTHSPDEDQRLVFLFAWIVGTLAFLLICAGIKRVQVDRQCLYISNYFHEISIPLSMIAAVTEVRWINIHPVRVHFKSATEFGRTIAFMPTARLGSPWSSHPVVTELNDLAHVSGDGRN
jgi:hypothetical protein